MSLGKLLTAGKSLVGLHDSNARYQLRKGALPKFESARNPFTSRPRAEMPAPIIEREPQLPKLTPAETAAAHLKKTQPLPVLDQPKQVEKPAQNPKPMQTAVENPKPAEIAKTPKAVESWVKKLNPLVWWSNRKPAQPKSAIPRFGKAPVQGELSLDNIKVMRNDLSDTDVEIVSLKTRVVKAPATPRQQQQAPAPAVSAAAAAIPELPPATNAWEFLGERVLGKH